MTLPTVGDDLPSVVASGGGDLTRSEADDIYVEQANAPGYDDILTATAAAHMLQAQRATLAFGDTTAKPLFTLPAGAVPIAFVINVTEAFDGDTSNVIDLGVDGTPDQFVADFDVSSGNTGLTVQPSADESALASETVVEGVYTPGGGTPSAGAVTVTVLYIVPA